MMCASLSSFVYGACHSHWCLIVLVFITVAGSSCWINYPLCSLLFICPNIICLENEMLHDWQSTKPPQRSPLFFFYGPFSWNTVDPPFSLAVKQTYLQCFQNALAHNCIRLSITSTRALLVLFCDLAPINLIKTSWLIAGWKSGILLVTKEMHAPGNLLRHFIRSYIYYVLFIICRSLCFLCMIMKAVPNKPISRKQCVWKDHVLTAWFVWKVI